VKLTEDVTNDRIALLSSTEFKMSFFENSINTVVLGEALAILQKFPDACVDAVVTDPPFGIGFKYKEVEDHCKPEEYWEWLQPIYREIERVTKPGGFIAVWQGQEYFPYFWSWFGSDIHIYASCKNFVQLHKTAINPAYFPVIMKYKPGAEELRPSKPKRNVDFFVSESHRLLLDKNRIEKEHPCPRPVDAVEEILKNFVLPNGLVLDPFMGSGTCAIACINTNRKYIGVEKDPTYHDLCLRRIALTQDFFGTIFGSSSE